MGESIEARPFLVLTNISSPNKMGKYLLFTYFIIIFAFI